MIHVPFFASSQLPALQSGANLPPTGPTVTLHVVGIEAAEWSSLRTGARIRPVYDAGICRRREPPNDSLPRAYLVRLHHGTADPPSIHPTDVRDFPPRLRIKSRHFGRAVAQSIHPRPWAGGCWPALAALAGLAVSRAGARSAEHRRERGYPKLGRLWDLSRRQLVVLGTARNLGGGAGRHGRRTSRCFRPVPPHSGRRRGWPSPPPAWPSIPLVLLVGALVTVVVVLVLGLWPSAARLAGPYR